MAFYIVKNLQPGAPRISGISSQVVPAGIFTYSNVLPVAPPGLGLPPNPARPQYSPSGPGISGSTPTTELPSQPQAVASVSGNPFLILAIAVVAFLILR